MSKSMPALRFKREDGGEYPEWEEKTVGELYDFYPTNSLSRDKLTLNDTSKIMNIHYGDIHTKFGSVLNAGNHKMPFIKSEYANVSNYEKGFEGDVFIADASEDYNDIGKATELIERNGYEIVGGLHVLHLRDKSNRHVNGFRGNLFNSNLVRSQIKILAVGSKVLGISKPSMGSIQLVIPCSEEQQKIASFLSTLDSRITLQSEKVGGLQELKKGLMQKIFSQEIRFRREDGGEYPEWTKKSLAEICRIIGGGTPSRKNKDYYSGSIPWATVKDLKDSDYKDATEEYISELGLKNSTSKIVPANNFIISTRMGLGRGFVNLVDMAINQDLKGLIVDSSIIEASFLMYWYKGQSSIIKALGSGSTVQGVTLNEINSLVISCPSLSEQNEVISFLSTLDSKIDLEKQILKELQVLKKGLLQQMFV